MSEGAAGINPQHGKCTTNHLANLHSINNLINKLDIPMINVEKIAEMVRMQRLSIPIKLCDSEIIFFR